MTQASVTVRNLTKVFALAEHGGGHVSLFGALRAGRPESGLREVRALDDVSFTLKEGDRVGIIGPNGAGKTTLLSILAGIAAPTSGHVEVEGDVHAMLTIGAVLRDDLTGRQNIDLDASVHGRSPADTAAVRDRIIEFSELGEFIDRPVQTYSSGMKARLAFSMGAFINPDILIVDETLSVGDAFFSEKASRRMREVAAGGRIVIVVAHGLAAIVDMCSRCLWIDNGRVVMDGDPKTVTAAYQQAVQQADEAELAQKFGRATSSENLRRDVARLDQLSLHQANDERLTAVSAVQPLQITVKGSMDALSGASDGQLEGGRMLIMSLLRVDGRLVWRYESSDADLRLPDEGGFEACIHMDPLLLGADLYRLEATLVDDVGVLDTLARVFNVVDEEGQHGGAPLLLCPPQIKARAKTGVPS